MKNLLVIALMTLLSAATFANAENPIKDNSQLSVTAEEAQTAVILRLTNLEELPTTVFLKNDNNAVVFTKKMKATTAIALRLDLTQIPTGEYTLNVKRDAKTFVQDITINKDGSVRIGEMATWVKPVMTQETGSFTVTNPNAAVKSVKIYNKKGDLIYAKKYRAKEKEAAKVKFNLEQVKKGEYTVIVSTFNDAYDFDLKVD